MFAIVDINNKNDSILFDTQRRNIEAVDGASFIAEYDDDDDDDSGLFADAFDVLPDKLTLPIDENLTNFILDEISQLEKKGNNHGEKHPMLFGLEDNKEDNISKLGFNKHKVLPKIPSVEKIEGRKMSSISRNRDREWRRKRILKSKVNSDISNSPNETTIKIEKEVKDPLLGGEKIRANREPVPMRLRALPETFWNEPNSINDTLSTVCCDTILPPLFAGEASKGNFSEGITVRPITPPEKTSTSPRYSPSNKKKWVMTSPPNVELLNSLFDHLEKKYDDGMIVRRGRPRKRQEERIPPPPPRDGNDDPCIVDALATKLFPELSLNHRPGQKKSPANFSVVRIGKGDRKVEFPAIQMQKNYPAILNELVAHM